MTERSAASEEVERDKGNARLASDWAKPGSRLSKSQAPDAEVESDRSSPKADRTSPGRKARDYCLLFRTVQFYSHPTQPPLSHWRRLM